MSPQSAAGLGAGFFYWLVRSPFFFFCSSWNGLTQAPEAAAQLPGAGTVPLTSDQVQAGRVVHDAQCASCHGPSGNFMRTGNPNQPDLPTWDEYDVEQKRVIHLTYPIDGEYDGYGAHHCDFWNDWPPARFLR